jgi:DNA mismatch repair protein MutL
MKIHKLPKNITNILSAGEVVERPYSVVKELVENSIDAQATQITITIEKWGNKLINISDNGTWIEKDDLPLTITEYATSKISKLEDIYNIWSFWFRWEALSTIAEVSKFRIQTKTTEEQIWYELNKLWKDINIQVIPVNFEHGTNIIVEDLFYNVPVRAKFLKSEKTEFKYIHELIENFAIKNYNIEFKLIHNWKTIKHFTKTNSLFDRLLQIYPTSWKKNILNLEHKDEFYQIYGVVGKSILKFNSNKIKIFVNSRPVKDRIIQKAIMQAYSRWLEPGLYPFVVLFLEIKPDLVDVNIHPRKEEVKFLDPGSIYNLVLNTVKWTIEQEKWIDDKTNYINFSKQDFWNYKQTKSNLNIEDMKKVGKTIKQDNLDLDYQTNFFFQENQIENKEFTIIWQIFDSYILFQKNDDFFIMDQHAVAERIIFEKMKKEYSKDKQSILSVPLTFEIIKKNNDILEKLQNIWFDISYFWEKKVILYSVPEILTKYNIDISNLINNLINSNFEDININKVLEQTLATKSCKAAIKANHKLSNLEMQQLIEDGQKYIDGFFVCQHGRPSVVKISKHDIDWFFDRK